MTAHDPACQWQETPAYRAARYCPGCDLIARIRADEAARWSEVAVRNAGIAATEALRVGAEEIAQAIEDKAPMRGGTMTDQTTPVPPSAYPGGYWGKVTPTRRGYRWEAGRAHLHAHHWGWTRSHARAVRKANRAIERMRQLDERYEGQEGAATRWEVP